MVGKIFIRGYFIKEKPLKRRRFSFQKSDVKVLVFVGSGAVPV